MPRLNLSEDDSKKMGKLIVEAWRYGRKRKALLENPEKVMVEAGITIPAVEATRIVALEDTQTTIHLVLPVRPRELTVAEMGTDDFHLELGTKIFAACR